MIPLPKNDCLELFLPQEGIALLMVQAADRYSRHFRWPVFQQLNFFLNV